MVCAWARGVGGQPPEAAARIARSVHSELHRQTGRTSSDARRDRKSLLAAVSSLTGARRCEGSRPKADQVERIVDEGRRDQNAVTRAALSCRHGWACLVGAHEYTQRQQSVRRRRREREPPSRLAVPRRAIRAAGQSGETLPGTHAPHCAARRITCTLFGQGSLTLTDHTLRQRLQARLPLLPISSALLPLRPRPRPRANTTVRNRRVALRGERPLEQAPHADPRSDDDEERQERVRPAPLVQRREAVDDRLSMVRRTASATAAGRGHTGGDARWQSGRGTAATSAPLPARCGSPLR